MARDGAFSSLIQNPPAGAPVPPILPQLDGFLFLDNVIEQASKSLALAAR